MSNNRSTSLNGEELDLERQLQQLVIAPHGIDRDALMFQAGRRAGRQHAHPWQALSGVLAVLAVILTVSSLGLRSNDPDDNLVAIPVDSETATMAVTPRAGTQGTAEPGLAIRWPFPKGAPLLQMRERLMSEGLDALPTPVPVTPSTDMPTSILEWLRQTEAGTALNITRFVNEHLSLGDPS